MPEFITKIGLTDDNGDAVRRIESGDSLTRGEIPVGELAPLCPRRFVSGDEALAVFRDAPSIDANRFKASVNRVFTSQLG